MAEVSDEEISLYSLLDPTKALVNDIEDGKFSTKELQPRIKSGIEKLHEITKTVNQLGLFSSNEQIEDIPTTSLPFLMVPCFLGIFHQNVIVEPCEKLDELRKAKVYLRNYLERLKNLCLITTRLPWVDEETEDKKTNVQKKIPAEEIRKLKLERHKKKQELKKAELSIQRQLEAVSIDDQNLRDLYITQTLYWCERAYEELQSVEEEIPLLRMMADRNSKGVPPPPPPTRTVPNLKPFVITRDAQQKEVFGLGYPSIPALTVDEWYHQKFGCGGQNVPQSSAPQQSAHSESDEEDDDAARRKAMQWDEYKDDHRRGWGNMHNKG